MFPRYQRYREDGFTLIELLVVMIVIGLLAAVAVPIFLNQQKTARDTQTISDVKNMMNNIMNAQVRYPDAPYYLILDQPLADVEAAVLPTASGASNMYDANGDGKLTLVVGNSSTENVKTEVSVSPGTRFNLSNGGSVQLPGGQFRLRGWNVDGKSHTSYLNGYLVQTDRGGYVPGG